MNTNLLLKQFFSFSKKISVYFLLLMYVFSFFGLTALAQERQRNPISLRITTVNKNGQTINNRSTAQDVWTIDERLSLDDTIRYNWEGVDLNLKYKANPTRQGGWLKIYKTSVAQENLLLEQGTDNYPLKLLDIGSRLEEGQNSLLFVYVNSFTKVEYAPVIFNFNFVKESSAPIVRVKEPQSKAVFMSDIEQEVILELTNFRLTSSVSNEPNTGKIRIFHGNTQPQNIIGEFANGKTLPNGKFEIALTSKDLDFTNVPDSQSTNLIFVLVNSQGSPVGIQSQVEVITNYNRTLDVGLPIVSILEPTENQINQEVDLNTPFLIKVENFELLSERPNSDTAPSQNQQGFLQIIVTNGEFSQTLQPIWTKNEFNLQEIGYKSNSEGLRTVKIQLVDQNFEILKPVAEDSVDIFFKPPQNDNKDSEVKVQTNVWRFVVIGLTVVLIVGGISVLITRG
jgi:hypothetical protein